MYSIQQQFFRLFRTGSIRQYARAEVMKIRQSYWIENKYIMSGSGSVSASLRAMLNSFYKLQYLQYHQHFVKGLQKDPIRRDHFVFPGENRSVQFAQFVDIALWLLSVVNENEPFSDFDEFDDPGTIVQKLVIEMQKIGYNSTFPETKLIMGYGEATTAALDFLTDQALEKTGFQFEAPEYGTSQHDGGHDGDDDEIADETGMNESMSMSDDDPDVDDSSSERDAKRIKSNVDQVEWKAELDRVSQRLIVPKATIGDKNWRSFLDSSMEHLRMMDEVSKSLEPQLQHISRTVSGDIEQIATKEAIVNQNFRKQIDEFQNEKLQQLKLEKSHEERTERKKELAEKLDQTLKELEEVKKMMDERGNSMTDTTPLVQMRESLQRLRDENKELDIRIGVLDYTITQCMIKNRSSQKCISQENDDEE
mmetsp:Transcript_3225/g.6890  ORF Transcript_3225/g.6890 Transcript_3225/m.6890 type:complete len:422 (+) Transcript_3225:27-1292(+)